MTISLSNLLYAEINVLSIYLNFVSISNDKTPLTKNLLTLLYDKITNFILNFIPI